MKKQWGRWSAESENLLLRFCSDEGDCLYTIPLTSCNSSSEILDWIVRLKEKRWIRKRDIADLVIALDDLLGLQENFSGDSWLYFGHSGEYPRRILEKRMGRRNVPEEFRELLS
jgi:hypothetical protein